MSFMKSFSEPFIADDKVKPTSLHENEDALQNGSF